MTGWVLASEQMPRQGQVVVVLTREWAIPFCGYWKDNGSGPYWVVPGKGGTVEFWCDCIPLPYPDETKEEFRTSHERHRRV